MTGEVNAVVEGADVDLEGPSLLLALRFADGAVRRVMIPLRPDADGAIPKALGVRYVTQLAGRAVRARLDGENVRDIGHVIEERWIVWDEKASEEAAEMEMDGRNEP